MEINSGYKKSRQNFTGFRIIKVKNQKLIVDITGK